MAISQAAQSIRDERGAQMFPTLPPEAVARLSRFGDRQSYRAGEQIMRALILRRVGLIESGGGGPIVIGRSDSPDVLRLTGFLRRNGHPFQLVDCETDSCANTLVERFRIEAEQLPVVLCPGGQLLHDPPEDVLARYIGLDNVEIVTGAEVRALEGEDGMLGAVTWCDRKSGEKTRREIRELFSFIGAEPNTDWLAESGIRLDPRGFVCTGADAGDERHLLETSRKGIFVVGDVRASSVKRVASSVGDGAQVVAAIHSVLAEMRERELVVQ